MARIFLILTWFLAGVGAVSAAPVAVLASLEGEVTLLRSGVLVPSEKLSDGSAVEAFDTVSTGLTGRAEIRFAAGVGITGFLRLDPGTTVYLDLTAAKKDQTVGVELLTGAVSVRVSSAAPNSLVEVRTSAGRFSGPGPSFRVVGTSGGDVLATSAAGKVECRFPQRTVFIEPGSVVQVLALDGTVQTLPMNVSTLDAFEGTWVLQRRQNFRDQAAVVFRSLAVRYQLEGAHFQRAWDRYQRESKDDEKGLKAAVANLRTAAAPLERTLYQIRALKVLADDGGLQPSLELSRGYAARDFFRQAAQEDPLWSGRLAEARGFYKTLNERLGGVFPQAAGLSVTWSTDFFH